MFEISGIGIATAVAAGLISFLSPCVLPLVPGYVSYVAGKSLESVRRPEAGRAKLTALILSIFFVAGFSTVFVSWWRALPHWGISCSPTAMKRT